MSSAGFARSFMRPCGAALAGCALIAGLIGCDSGDDDEVVVDASAPEVDAKGHDTADVELDAGAPISDTAVLEDDAGADGALPDLGPVTIMPLTDLTFDAPAAWANPIADYLTAGEGHVEPGADFLRGIHDLTVYADRLYLGYGDANINMGQVIPIEFRSIRDPRTAEAVSEFVSADEQLDRYRRIGDRLYMAGIDATGDEWLGNVYYRDAEEGWVMSRTLDGGVHVHDITGFGDAIFAVGSGAAPDEWNSGNIFGHLWRTTDGGDSFEIVHRHHNGGRGDARFTSLVPGGNNLYILGYLADGNGIYDLPNSLWNGTTANVLKNTHPLRYVFALDTLIFDDETSLLRGINLAESPPVNRLWTVGEIVEPIDAFARLTVVDFYLRAETGEVVILTHDGNGVPAAAAPGGRTLTVWVSSDLETFTPVLDLVVDALPVAVASWRNALYFGTAHGQILQARGHQE